MTQARVNQNPSLADVAVVEAATNRLADATADSSERQERMAERAVSEYEERNRPIDRLVGIDVWQLRAEDKRRRLEKYYGRRGLRQWDSYFAGADTRGNLRWTDEAMRRGMKILMKGGIAGALSLTVAGILGGGVAIPVVVTGVGIGIAARTAWEAGRIAFGKERRERNEIELANQAVIEKILELVDELQELRVEIASEDTTLSSEQIEADPRFKELEIEIIEMLHDDTARRARKVVDDRGKTRYIGLRKGEGANEEGKEEDDVINIGEKEKGLVKTERWLEAGGDILALTATVGASVLGGLDKAVALTEAAKEAAMQSGEEAAKKAGEELAKGGPLGPFDFDGAAIPDGVKEHMVKAVEGVRPFFDQLSGVWHDSVENLQGAIGKLAENAALVENIARAKVAIADLTRSLIGVGAVNLAQFFAGRLGHKNFIESEAREKKQVARARELIEKIPEIKIDSIAMPEVEERKELEAGWVVEISSNPQTRKRLGIADKFKNFDQFYINKFYNAGGERYAELLPLSKVDGQNVVYKQGDIIGLDAKHLQYPFSTTEIVRIAKARLSESETDDGAKIVENSQDDSNAGVVRESDSGEEGSAQLRPTEEPGQGGEDGRENIEIERDELAGSEQDVIVGNFVVGRRNQFYCEINGIKRRVTLTADPPREISTGEKIKIRINENTGDSNIDGVRGDKNQFIKATVIELPDAIKPEEAEEDQEDEASARVPEVYSEALRKKVVGLGGNVSEIVADLWDRLNGLEKKKTSGQISDDEWNELMGLRSKANGKMEQWLSDRQLEAIAGEVGAVEDVVQGAGELELEEKRSEEKLRDLAKKWLSPGSKWVHSGNRNRSKIKSANQPEEEISCLNKVFVLDRINKDNRKWFVEIHQLDQIGDEEKLRVEPEKFRQVLAPKSLVEMPNGEEKDKAREILLEEFKKMLDRAPVLNTPDDNDNNGTAVSGEAEADLPQATGGGDELRAADDLRVPDEGVIVKPLSETPSPQTVAIGGDSNVDVQGSRVDTRLTSDQEQSSRYIGIKSVDDLKNGDKIFKKIGVGGDVEVTDAEGAAYTLRDIAGREFIFGGPVNSPDNAGLFEITSDGNTYYLYDSDLTGNFEIENLDQALAKKTELDTMHREIDEGIRQGLADEERARQSIESYPLYDESGSATDIKPGQVWRIVKEDGSSEDLKIIGITRDNNSGILTINFENQEPVTGSVEEFQEYFGDSELIEGGK